MTRRVSASDSPEVQDGEQTAVPEWRVDAPVCRDPKACDLRAGQVVEWRSREGKVERGIVQIAHCIEGERQPVIASVAGDCVISVGPGTQYVTNMHEQFRQVPRSEQTTTERVRVAMIRWDPADWREAQEASISGDPYSWEFAVLRAFLTDTEHDEVFPEDGDWPIGVDELAVLVARHIDARAALYGPPLAPPTAASQGVEPQ